MTDGNRIQLRHPEKGKSMPRIEAGTYAAFRKAILRAVPKRQGGILFKDLPTKVASLLPRAVTDGVGSISWYTTSIKLDLEARGEIERVPGSSPQRLRRRR